ncbi:hypothetical protein [Lacticigenium naphthae]|uniref:hypothetical protein n=1 Tax=Lacticigenium naphthae TaxID=515351 RepID=UPI000410EE63|nr:hypothetical protein [Lacticigenium naphthae]
MIIEKKINEILTKYPIIKKSVKRLYQVTFYLLSNKEEKKGNINRVTPNDQFEYFFGYYDKSPWDSDERYMLCLRVQDTSKSVAPKEPAELLLIDTKNDNTLTSLGYTNAWNVQQGCMMQWLGPNYNEEIIYNDFIEGEYRSIILNIVTKEKRIISKPIYSITEDGNYALSLDFSRLHRLRKGYGYSNKEDASKNEKVPTSTAIWKVNLKTNEVTDLLSYSDFYNFENDKSMSDAEHKVNHIMINPSGDRFMVLHRWLKGTNKFTRLVTIDMDGKKMFNLNDDKMTSHCFWKNDYEIIAYANKQGKGSGYYLFKDKSLNYEEILTSLKNDGHPSYSPDKEWIITDTYPDRKRIANIYLAKESGEINTLAQVFAPFKYDNDVRCDLHPRWNRSSTAIAFDSVFEGKRRMYTIEVKPENFLEK